MNCLLFLCHQHHSRHCSMTSKGILMNHNLTTVKIVCNLCEPNSNTVRSRCIRRSTPSKPASQWKGSFFLHKCKTKTEVHKWINDFFFSYKKLSYDDLFLGLQNYSRRKIERRFFSLGLPFFTFQLLPTSITFYTTADPRMCTHKTSYKKKKKNPRRQILRIDNLHFYQITQRKCGTSLF